MSAPTFANLVVHTNTTLKHYKLYHTRAVNWLYIVSNRNTNHSCTQTHNCSVKGRAPVFWSSQGLCWVFAAEQKSQRVSRSQQPCYLEGLEPKSLSAWQQSAWGGRPWWQEVRGVSWRAGAPEVPQNMKTQDEQEKRLERDDSSGLPHGCRAEPDSGGAEGYAQNSICMVWVVPWLPDSAARGLLHWPLAPTVRREAPSETNWYQRES